MDDVSEQDRAALLALVGVALRDEGRTVPPPEAERGACAPAHPQVWRSVRAGVPDDRQGECAVRRRCCRGAGGELQLQIDPTMCGR